MGNVNTLMTNTLPIQSFLHSDNTDSTKLYFAISQHIKHNHPTTPEIKNEFTVVNEAKYFLTLKVSQDFYTTIQNHIEQTHDYTFDEDAIDALVERGQSNAERYNIDTTQHDYWFTIEKP